MPHASKLAMGEIDCSDYSIPLDQTNCFRQRYMSRNQHDAQVGRHESHRVFLRAGQMSEKLCVPWETVTTKKERTFVDRRSGDGVNAPGSTQFNGRLYVTGSSFAGGA